MRARPQVFFTSQAIINNNRLLSAALDAPIQVLGWQHHLNKHQAFDHQAILAWGLRPSAQKAERLSKRLNLPLWRAEDGFLRSLDSGTKSRYAASFVLDDLGIYFDLTRPNRLQSLIYHTVQDWNEVKQAYADALIDKLINHKLSKYNASSTAPNLSLLAKNNKPHVIIVDQVVGDASVTGAGADAQSFFAMYDAARRIYPEANIWIKAHPAGQGYFGTQHRDALVIGESCNPIALLEQAEAVFTVSSHMGFEALMLGKTVHCFGVNWYSGFGLTIDDFIKDSKLYRQVQAQYLDHPCPNVAQLFYASYIEYSYYADPATGRRSDIETVMDYLITNRYWQDRLAGDLLAYDFSRWKVSFVKGFVKFPQTDLVFKSKTKMRLFYTDRYNAWRAQQDDKKSLRALPDHQRYLVWGLAAKQSLAQKILDYQDRACADILCMEDGFIRSNGLGATLIEPLSVVIDDLGIYFDATCPSRLETILKTIHLDDKQRQRAQRLHQLLLSHQVSKYNVGNKNHTLLERIDELKATKPEAKVHLVVGQVEDDASVQNCASLIKKNGELLNKVRQQFPQDIIIYKPHPDVEAGLRHGKLDDKTQQLADVIAHDAAMPMCLEHCDVVHTISSLTGFEALLRGLDVVCYGMPFYAGFGLTQDVIEPDNTLKQAALARRSRNQPLTLEALIYGVLIDYPIYHLPNQYGLAQCEQVIEYIYQHSANAKPPSVIHRVKRMAKTRLMQLRKFTIR